MNKIKCIATPLIFLVTTVFVSAFSTNNSAPEETEVVSIRDNIENQTINLFVTHGHCSTPFGGIVSNLEVITQTRDDLGNPLEGMKISFEIDPNSFNVCAGDDLTARIKTPGLFIGENDEKITFKTTDVYTMGLDWYQINGKMGIKGVEKEVKFFVTGIRNPEDAMPSSLVLEGQVNLLDWGIDYDLIVNGVSNKVQTKWLHLNMKIEMSTL